MIEFLPAVKTHNNHRKFAVNKLCIYCKLNFHNIE
jgi:hypothetical protein